MQPKVCHKQGLRTHVGTLLGSQAHIEDKKVFCLVHARSASKKVNHNWYRHELAEVCGLIACVRFNRWSTTFSKSSSKHHTCGHIRRRPIRICKNQQRNCLQTVITSLHWMIARIVEKNWFIQEFSMIPVPSCELTYANIQNANCLHNSQGSIPVYTHCWVQIWAKNQVKGTSKFARRKRDIEHVKSLIETKQRTNQTYSCKRHQALCLDEPEVGDASLHYRNCTHWT